MHYSRRRFIKGMVASMALPFLTGTSLSFAAPKAGPIIHTQKGKVQGMIVDGIHVFLGVPCGKPPYEPVRRLGLPELSIPGRESSHVPRKPLFPCREVVSSLTVKKDRWLPTASLCLERTPAFLLKAEETACA